MILDVARLEELILSVMVWWALGYGAGLVHRVIKNVIEKVK